MTLAVLAVLLVTAVAGAQWLLAGLRSVPSGGPPVSSADVAVVVPARDEEENVPALLQALSLSEVAVREVVVVDDGSRDATAAVARAGGARVLVAEPPPTGWTGKASACDLGARESSGDLLLFLDADTRLSPRALGGLLAVHAERGGLVSVQPFHEVARPYEQVSAYFNAVSVLASGAFRARPAGPPMAFGPCLLTTRADYDRAGGHAAVRSAVLDDVELAGAYDRAGLPVQCLAGGRLVRMRSYPGGPAQLVAGWTKNVASGASAASPLPAGLTVLWLSVHHAVAVGTLASLVETLSGADWSVAAGPPVAWVVAWVVVAWHLRSVLRAVGSFRWWAWAAFPLTLLAFDLVFARSCVQTAVRRSVRWRGRAVDLRSGDPTQGGR